MFLYLKAVCIKIQQLYPTGSIPLYTKYNTRNNGKGKFLYCKNCNWLDCDQHTCSNKYVRVNIFGHLYLLTCLHAGITSTSNGFLIPQW